MKTKCDYVYKITNNINDKIYVGIHYGFIDDEYYGSGTNIKRAINKYGIDNFTKDILVIGESREYVANIESQIVTEEFCSRKDTYNIVVGGGIPPIYYGSDNYMFGKTHTDEAKQKIRDAQTGRPSTFKGKPRPKHIQDMLRDNGKNKCTTRKKLLMIDDDGNTVRVFNSLREASRELKCDVGGLSKTANGKYGYKKYKGYFWEYCTE